MSRLSLTVIARDAEAALPTCLASGANHWQLGHCGRHRLRPALK